MGDGNGEPGGALDDAASGFLSLERTLARRGTRTSRSREDANVLRAVIGAWFETSYPTLVATLGDFPAITDVSRELRDLRALAGGRINIPALRRRLRAVARRIEREILPAYDAARWTAAATVQRSAGEMRESLAGRLRGLSPELADSFAQVYTDTADPDRQTFLGPAGEIREVMRGAIHLLSPDDEVRAQAWYVGVEGRPTQAERIRFILQSRQGVGSDSAIETAEVVDTKVGRLGRLLYQRASRAFHAGTQRDEVRRIVGWVEAVLNEILPS